MHKKKVCIHLLLYATKTTSQNHKGDMIKMFLWWKESFMLLYKNKVLNHDHACNLQTPCGLPWNLEWHSYKTLVLFHGQLWVVKDDET